MLQNRILWSIGADLNFEARLLRSIYDSDWSIFHVPLSIKLSNLILGLNERHIDQLEMQMVDT